jgi:diacylglycerol kinase (ATP)
MARTRSRTEQARKSKLKKIKLIFNPQSGSGATLAWPGDARTLTQNKTESPQFYLQQILLALKAQGLDAEMLMAHSPSAATAAARRCAKNRYDLVIAVGGDGTINAVVNGLAGSQTALGVIPAGTVNLFCLQMNIPLDLDEACRRLARGRQITIDLGRVAQRYFTCVAGVGFDAFVIKTTDWRLKRLTGAFAYLVSGIAAFFLYPFRQVWVRIDGQPEPRRGYLVIAGNVKYYGGNMVLLPRADLQDGKLDVCVFKRRNFFSFLSYLWGWQHGALDKFLDVEYLQCQRVTVLNRRQHLQLDGEYLGHVPVDIEVVPQALRVVV